MALPPPARIGDAFAAVDTPALVVDLDAFDRNLARMADAARRLGMRLRPHAKSHKSPVIARRQMDLGAVGVCCQKVSEAEVLVQGGVPDVLVSNEIVGARKAARLAALAREARIGVCVDDPAALADLSGAAVQFGATLEVLVEIDVGGRRCGVTSSEAAVRLAQAIAAAPGLRFGGLQAYHGSAQHFRTPAERRAAIAAAGAFTAATIAALSSVGLDCRTVGGAGTGTFELEGAGRIWNELQPGSYIFMDADYARNLNEDGGPVRTFEHALFVKAMVMSRPAPERAVIDAGHKALSNDSGFPEVHGNAGARYHRPSDEHGILDLTAAQHAPALGETMLLVPGHCDPTVNLYDWYVGVRGLHGPDAHVAALWPVAGRGAVT
ncbi:MAG: DSD1 family PLP-dependent enzyme [Hyphomicrobiaceae bacterium]